MSRTRPYLDLTLELRDLDEAADSFTVSLSSPAVGETDPVVVPYGYEADLEDQLDDLERKRLGPEALIELGQKLAARLLPEGQIRTLFLQAYKQAGQEGGVRLRLVIWEPKLAQLPWEYSYLQIHPGETDLRHFLALNPQLSLVRHPPLAEAHPSLAPLQPGPLHLVAATANVKGYGRLKLKRERAVLEKALASTGPEEIALVWEAFLEDATLADLRQALWRKPILFHFAGHGTFETDSSVPAAATGTTSRGLTWAGALEQAPRPGQGAIVLAASKEEPSPYHFPANQLAAELQQAGVRLALLGACESGRQDGINVWTGIAPALIERGIPAVVAMQYEVIDEAAIAFSQSFYAALVQGLSVDEAVAAGRLAMWHSQKRDEAEWGVPVLYMRAIDGLIFPERAADPAREADRAQSRIKINQQIETLYGQATAVEVGQMLQGQIEAQQRVKTVGVGGNLVGVKIETMGGGKVKVGQNIDTVEGDGSVIGAKLDNL